MNGLEVAHLTVRYPGKPPVTAVDDVSLTVARGEIVALVGPSGCGKSSLLGAIVGTVEPAQGTVHFASQDLLALPIHQRGCGLVFQDGQLFPHLDVAANVGFGLRFLPLDHTSRERRVAELLDLVGMSHMGGRSVDQLSGGERQRVALARSLAPSPRLIALDEPLASLDTDLRRRLAEDVRTILVEAQMTALVVTHDQDEAQRMADRVVRMKTGRLEPGS